MTPGPAGQGLQTHHGGQTELTRRGGLGHPAGRSFQCLTFSGQHVHIRIQAPLEAGCTEFLPHGHRQPELESHRLFRGHFLPLGLVYQFPSLSALTFWAGAFESLQETSAKSTPDLLRAGHSGGMKARLNELMNDQSDPCDSQPVSLESQPLCRVAELGCDAGLLFLLPDPTQAPGSVRSCLP